MLLDGQIFMLHYFRIKKLYDKTEWDTSAFDLCQCCKFNWQKHKYYKENTKALLVASGEVGLGLTAEKE
jgi:hypothetical protein